MTRAPAPTFAVNDQRRHTLILCLAGGAVIGVMIGALIAGLGNSRPLPTTVGMGAVALNAVVVIANSVVLLHAQRRRNQAALAATRQPLTELPVPARVVNYRSGGLVSAPGCALVQWTVLPDDGPARRAVSVTPWPWPMLPTFAKGSVHGVRLSALSPDVCVLDQGATPSWRARAAADPRWAGPLPTITAIAGLSLAVPLAFAAMAVTGLGTYLLLR